MTTLKQMFTTVYGSQIQAQLQAQAQMQCQTGPTGCYGSIGCGITYTCPPGYTGCTGSYNCKDCNLRYWNGRAVEALKKVCESETLVEYLTSPDEFERKLAEIIYNERMKLKDFNAKRSELQPL